MHRLLHANSCKSREYESNYHPAPATLFIVIWTASKREFTHTYAYYPRNLWRRPRIMHLNFTIPDRTRGRNHWNYWIIYRPDAGRREIFFPGSKKTVKLLEFSPSGKLIRLTAIWFWVFWIIAFYETLVLLSTEYNTILCYYIIDLIINELFMQY